MSIRTPEAPGPDLTVLDQDFIAEIRAIGFHPFILVRLGGRETPAEKYIACLTQNDAPRFVGELGELPSFAESKLVRGVERALQLEIYDAAELLFSWVNGQSTVDETLYLGLDEDTALPSYVGYAAFGFGEAKPPATPRGRAELLVKALDSYAETYGNDALRQILIEAFAFALSRSLGAMGEYAEAARVIDVALGFRPYSIYLKAARHALTLKLEAKEVSPRLAKFIGEDNGYLRQFVCPEPFDRFDIGPSGEVLVCCGHWLPTSIGNILTDSVENILNSARAQRIRESVTDGSYKYCNHLECGAMIQGILPTREAVTSSRAREAVASGDYRIDGVDQVLFAFDQTCNLSCPSCRRERIVERLSESEEKARAVEQKLLPLLPKLRVLNINPAGELFASKPSRKILELVNEERCPDLVLDIISNGTLFSEEEWNKFPGIHKKVRSVRISVDAARKETFEKLRRLGKYDVFLRNMRFLSSLRQAGAISELKFSFTYQLDNFKEMREFVTFCENMSCDFAIFERLQNLGAFTHDEFRSKAVHHTTHPLYAEFIELIKDPAFRDTKVWHDFDYEGVVNMSHDEAASRYAKLRAAYSDQGPIEAVTV
jgi:Iron-sulfur cluster-binding domain